MVWIAKTNDCRSEPQMPFLRCAALRPRTACSRALDDCLRPQAAAAGGEGIPKAVGEVVVGELAAAAVGAWSEGEALDAGAVSRVDRVVPDGAQVLGVNVPHNMAQRMPRFALQQVGVGVEQRRAGCHFALPADRQRAAFDEDAHIVATAEVVPRQGDVQPAVKRRQESRAGGIVQVHLGQAQARQPGRGQVGHVAQGMRVEHLILELSRVGQHVADLEMLRAEGAPQLEHGGQLVDVALHGDKRHADLGPRMVAALAQLAEQVQVSEHVGQLGAQAHVSVAFRGGAIQRDPQQVETGVDEGLAGFAIEERPVGDQLGAAADAVSAGDQLGCLWVKQGFAQAAKMQRRARLDYFQAGEQAGERFFTHPPQPGLPIVAHAGAAGQIAAVRRLDVDLGQVAHRAVQAQVVVPGFQAQQCPGFYPVEGGNPGGQDKAALRVNFGPLSLGGGGERVHGGSRCNGFNRFPWQYDSSVPETHPAGMWEASPKPGDL